MEKDIIKQIILNQQEFISKVELLPRKLSMEKNANYVFVGIRRAGKTYMLYQHIQQLLRQGHDKQEILFINFEDERITDIRKEELHLIVECYKEMFACDPIIFLDEIQNVEGWEHFARRLADEKRQVFITGSNAHMLSREIASTLGGRYLMQEVYPFSFPEYLEYHHITLDAHWQLAPVRADVVRLFEGYFYNGGLPESFGYADKRAWLTSLYQKILYSDIVIRNNVRNEQSLRLLVRKLADSVLQPMAVKRLQNILQGDGSKVTRETISSYLGYLHDAYLIFSLSNFNDSIPQREGTKKHYFYDNGIRNAIIGAFSPLAIRQDVGALWENYIIGERRKVNFNEGAHKEFYFWRTYDKQEIDLIEEHANSLTALEFKWGNKMPNIPKAFQEAYPHAEFHVVNRENYLEFI